MSKLFEMVWDYFVEVFGAKTWEEVKRRGWPAVVAASLYAAWGVFVSPLGPMLFIDSLAVFALALLVTNQIQGRRLRKKWERGELPVPYDLQMMQANLNVAQLQVTDLQTQLATINDTQPHLVTDCFSELRRISPDRQPTPAPYNHLFEHRQDGSFATLAVLRVTNRPHNHSKDAIAEDVSAWVSYYDKDWKPLLQELPGIWLTLQQPDDQYEIGNLSTTPPVLKPNESVFLGIAIGEVFPDKTATGASMIYSAFTSSSHQWMGWIDSDVLLDGLGERGPVHVKVVLTCHRYAKEHYYILREKGEGNNLSTNKLLLELTSPPVTKE